MSVDIEMAEALISRVTRSSAVAGLGLVTVLICKGETERALELAEDLAKLSVENARDDLTTLLVFCGTFEGLVEVGTSEERLRASVLTTTRIVEKLEARLREMAG